MKRRLFTVFTLLVLLSTFLIYPKSAHAASTSVNVSATNSTGTPTGITVDLGQTVSIQASGFWCSGGIKNDGSASCGGPQGIRPFNPGEEVDLILPNELIGLLIGRIGNWYFPIGSSRQVSAQASGQLFLLMNDRTCCYADNSGQVTATITSGASNPAVAESITNVGSCPPVGPKSPTWGHFGSRQVLVADSGEELRVDCTPENTFHLYYTPPGGSPLTVGMCPFFNGCNSATFSYYGDLNNNGKPDLFVGTRWVSRDYGANDIPNLWTHDTQEPPNLLDWAVSVFDASSQTLLKLDYKYIYLQGPPVNASLCGSSTRPEGSIVQTIRVDPPIGPDTEAFFSGIDQEFQAQGAPSGPMIWSSFELCDLNQDGGCDVIDLTIFQNMIGKSEGDSGFLPLADANGDGTISQVDQPLLFPWISEGIDIKPGETPSPINLKSKGVIPVAILSSATFDATTVMPSSVRFGPNGASAFRNSIQDINGDGLPDLVLQFPVQQTGIQSGNTQACLTSTTTLGLAILGCDDIKIVH